VKFAFGVTVTVSAGDQFERDRRRSLQVGHALTQVSGGPDLVEAALASDQVDAWVWHFDPFDF
jgi:hypothetical protein